MRQFAPFFAVFAVLWVAQLYATAKQSQHFMREVGRLRKLGETSIGASTHNRLRRRSYVALASDDTDLVTGAIELSGLTVFSRAQPVPELVGIPLRRLADDEPDDRRTRAAAMAARALLGEDLEGSQVRSTPHPRSTASGRPVSRRPSTPHRSVPRGPSAHLPPSSKDVRDERGRGS